METLPKPDDLGGWEVVLRTAADALLASEQIDTSGSLPAECGVESAQFQAWIFGRLVADATSNSELAGHLFTMANDSSGLRELWGEEEGAQWWATVRTVAAIANSVEACLTCYFTAGLPVIDIQRNHPVSRATLGEWGHYFKGTRPNKVLDSVIRRTWPGVDPAELTRLGQHLLDTAAARAPIIHHAPLTSQQQKEKLDKIRKLVLGIDGSSILTLIRKLFSGAD